MIFSAAVLLSFETNVIFWFLSFRFKFMLVSFVCLHFAYRSLLQR